MRYNYSWFKENYEGNLKKFELSHKNILDNDTYINIIEIEGKGFGCEIMFYDYGRLDIFVYDYKREQIRLNFAFLKNEIEGKKEAFLKLSKVLGIQ